MLAMAAADINTYLIVGVTIIALLTGVVGFYTGINNLHNTKTQLAFQTAQMAALQDQKAHLERQDTNIQEVHVLVNERLESALAMIRALQANLASINEASAHAAEHDRLDLHLAIQTLTAIRESSKLPVTSTSVTEQRAQAVQALVDASAFGPIDPTTTNVLNAPATDPALWVREIPAADAPQLPTILTDDAPVIV